MHFSAARSCTPVLDIQPQDRFSYSQSPFFFQVSQGMGATPFEAKPTGKGEPQSGQVGVSQLKLPSGGNSAAIGTNRSYGIANRGLMSH